VVRGGAMTAFTIRSKAPNGWVPKTTGSSGYCVDTGTANSYVVFNNDSDSTKKTVGPLPPTWKVQLIGNDPRGGGLEFMPQSQNCARNDSSKTSITVTTINGVGSFYPSQLPPSGVHNSNHRFLDQPPGCVGDEDSWERMSNVIVLNSQTGAVVAQLPCLDGNCSVRIGPYNNSYDNLLNAANAALSLHYMRFVDCCWFLVGVHRHSHAAGKRIQSFRTPISPFGVATIRHTVVQCNWGIHDHPGNAVNGRKLPALTKRRVRPNHSVSPGA
jgi:hypothetical protein